VPDAAELLDEMTALRKRTRHDRHGYWLPLLVFGVLILVAPLIYQAWARQPGTVQSTGPQVHFGGIMFGPLSLFGQFQFFADPVAVAVYWLAVVVVGSLVTVGWYRWRAARVGVQPRLLTYVLYVLGALVVCVLPVPYVTGWLFVLFGRLGFASLWISLGVFLLGGLLAGLCVRRERSVVRWIGLVAGIVLMLVGGNVLAELTTTHGFGALLVIAVGLLGLAWMERSPWCGGVALAFTGAALLANLYNMENVYFDLFGFSTATVPNVLPNLLLPGLVLIAGGIVGLLRGRATR
jgi:hypothetical protein